MIKKHVPFTYLLFYVFVQPHQQTNCPSKSYTRCTLIDFNHYPFSYKLRRNKIKFPLKQSIASNCITDEKICIYRIDVLVDQSNLRAKKLTEKITIPPHVPRIQKRWLQSSFATKKMFSLLYTHMYIYVVTVYCTSVHSYVHYNVVWTKPLE